MNQSYVNYLKAMKKSDNTIKNYTKYVQSALNYINKPDNEITFLDLTDYQASISHLAPNSIRLQLAAIKSYFKFLQKASLISVNPAVDIEKPKANPKPKPYMTAEMIEAMVSNARTVRDRAIVKFMVSTGVRVSELINITLDDYIKAKDTHEIKIIGKGSKERIVFVNESTTKAIDEYLSIRPSYYKNYYLFTSFQGTQLEAEGLSKTLKNIAKRANIPFWQDISNHTMRSAFATIASERGVPVATISKAMGHANIATTSIYIKNSQANINNAMALMAF